MTASQKRVLIAEDEKPLARALSLKLEKEGFEVVAVYDGLEVQKKIATEKFDLILMDLMMPRMDGFSVIEDMKKQGSNIPVVIMSNLSQEIDQARAKEAGAVAYFIKSDIKLFEVISFIKKTLNI